MAEEFKVLALNGKGDSVALNYFEEMWTVWLAVSNALENVMNNMLML